jgi:hypothetical protein
MCITYWEARDELSFMNMTIRPANAYNRSEKQEALRSQRGHTTGGDLDQDLVVLGGGNRDLLDRELSRLRSFNDGR